MINKVTQKNNGLYDPSFEKDNCGFGLITQMDDIPSHWVIDTSIKALERLTHRGAISDDGKTSDGCGLLIKKPDSFFRKIALDLNIKLGVNYAFGSIFLNKKNLKKSKETLHFQLRKQGLDVKGWRDVPINKKVCGKDALLTLPEIKQVIVTAPDSMLWQTKVLETWVAGKKVFDRSTE